MIDKRLQTLAYRLKDSSTLRNLVSELNYDFEDKPVNKDNWNDGEKKIVLEAKIIASKNDYKIYYIKTKSDSLKEWKSVSAKIIKENNGLCMICSHNPRGFKWIFSSLSKDFSKSFSETRHVPIDIDPNIGIPNTFIEFLKKIKVEKNSTAASIASQVSNAFDNFAVQLHDELTVNVFEALKIISEGIIGDKNNNLSLTDETLEEIREPIFILLYRIIFILYAEDRGIFPVDNKIYQEEFSLRWIIKEWLLKSTDTKQLAEYHVEKRIKKLFRLIEMGSEELDYKKDEFFMRSYYGRIFDRKINHRLEEWHIPNTNMLEMVSLITRTNDKEGNYFFLDYSALETRHLGSIYEHLLEFHLHVENKKIAELPDQEERKKSGSYYTPKFVVDYIVRDSIEPLIESIIEKNPDKYLQIEKILSLKILDPAMGSGHFLVGAVEYMAKRLCEIEFGDVSEQSYIERKRDVVRRCIFGVDINPLSVDLARLSLWLETLSSEKPLSFLSAHLKTGNALVGTDLDSIYEKQTSLFESNKGRSAFKKNVKNFLMFESLEDDTPAHVKMKLEEYVKMQSEGTIYDDLKFLLDAQTSKFFGLDVPNLGDFREKIGKNSIEFHFDEKYKKIFENIKKISKAERFFHWELEFPQIFYNENGEKIKNGGFDAIIGNPPYVRAQIASDNEKQFLERKYDSAKGKYDLYILFIEKTLQLLKKDSILSLITTFRFTQTKYGEEIKRLILEKHWLKKLVNFGSLKIFKDATAYPAIFVIQKTNVKNKSIFIKVKQIPKEIKLFEKVDGEFKDNVYHAFEFDQTSLGIENWVFLPKNTMNIFKKLMKLEKLGKHTEKIVQGFITGSNPLFFPDIKKLNNFESEILKEVPKGKDVQRYHINYYGRKVIYPQDKDGKPINEKDFHKKFPKTYQYFISHESKLKNRKYYGKKVSELRGSWFSLVHPIGVKLFSQPKIITPNLSKTNRFALDTTNFFIEHDCYIVILKDKTLENYYFFLAILNSVITQFIIEQKSPMFGGGYYKYHTQYIEDLPVPEINSEQANKLKQSIVNTVKILIELKHKNFLNAEKTGDLEKIIQYEKDIDEKLILLYGLKTMDVQHIEDIMN